MRNRTQAVVRKFFESASLKPSFEAVTGQLPVADENEHRSVIGRSLGSCAERPDPRVRDIKFHDRAG